MQRTKRFTLSMDPHSSVYPRASCRPQSSSNESARTCCPLPSSLFPLFPPHKSPIIRRFARLVQRLTTNMAPLKARTSAYSTRVTIYETSATSETPHLTNTAPVTASPRRRTRSSAATAFDEAQATGLSLPDAQEELKPEVKARSPRKPKAHVERLAVPHPAPKRWEETYEVIRKQRERCASL